LLIKPVEDKLINRSITIIPDGKLSYIPFDALLYSLPEKIDKLDFKNLDYLIKKFSFNYCYSAGLYLNNFKTEKRAGKKLLAFAPVYGDYKNSGDDEYNRLAPLTGITDEVKSIAKYIKSQLFTGEKATESNFKNNYKDYDILHLAMHAILNDSLPLFSKLAFSPETNNLHTEDGWLTTSELYNLKLSSRLSVLSACNTGSGTIMEGEGVISLARGFFYAGCPSVVMTLWEVEDRSGAEIMSEFYRLLNAGKKKHEALRLAKLKHIEEANPVTAHPHAWLCYVTIGNTDALYSSNDYYFFIVILIILIGVVIDQLYKNKKARKIRA
jgi:CHAT domain-containing protein